MRLRRVPRAEGVIENSRFVIKDPTASRGCWKEQFGNDRPIRIEIGMGKGRFIMDMAAANPDINFIGIERQESVLFRAAEKLEASPLPNLLLLLYDAAGLADVFAPGEVDRIYLNFSDPWPKERHAKRRLTSGEFLKVYNEFLKADGRIEFKTDNRPLFDYSLISIEEHGWQTELVTFDLHHSEYVEGNIMTEYEEKFSQKGNPICKVVFHR